jgi:hypothetical protein
MKVTTSADPAVPAAGRGGYRGRSSRLRSGSGRLRAIPSRLVPSSLQRLFELAHELAGVGAVDEAVVEAQAEVLHRANGDGVVALGVGQHHRLLAQAADGQNRRLRLVEDGRAELAAEDAGVGQRKGAAGTSSGSSFLVRARSARSAMARARLQETEPLGLPDHGHNQPPLQSHGDAQVDPRVVVDEAVDQRSVDDGEFDQRLNGGGGDERHIGELDAVLLLEAGLFALAQAGDAGHVHLVDGVDVRADAHALDHALGDDGAHLGERPPAVRQLAVRLRRCCLRRARSGGADTSSLVMRPSEPEPAIWRRSRWLSLAMRRTSGEERGGLAESLCDCNRMPADGPRANYLRG